MGDHKENSQERAETIYSARKKNPGDLGAEGLKKIAKSITREEPKKKQPKERQPKTDDYSEISLLGATDAQMEDRSMRSSTLGPTWRFKKGSTEGSISVGLTDIVEDNSGEGRKNNRNSYPFGVSGNITFDGFGKNPPQKNSKKPHKKK